MGGRGEGEMVGGYSPPLIKTCTYTHTNLQPNPPVRQKVNQQEENLNTNTGVKSSRHNNFLFKKNSQAHILKRLGVSVTLALPRAPNAQSRFALEQHI